MNLERVKGKLRLFKTRSATAERAGRLVTLERAYGMLQTLYDTGTALIRFESIEQTVPRVLCMAIERLACRNAILILTARGPDRPLVCPAQEQGAASQAALEYARASHAYLVNAAATLGARARGAPAGSAPQLAAREGEAKPDFISLPLAVTRGSVLGTLQLEFARKPDEPALAFASALTSQLASAIARQASEEVVAASEKRFSDIVSIASDAIIVVDEQQRITLLNRGAQEIFGYSKEEILGAPLALLLPEPFHPDGAERFAADAGVSRRMGERTEVFGRRKDGQEFLAEAAIAKLQVADRWEFTLVLRDISEAKRIEGEQRFLAEAGVILGSELEYQETLRSVARLAVRSLADCCIIDGLDEHGHTQRLEVAMADPALSTLANELRQYPLPTHSNVFGNAVFETRKSELRPELSPNFAESVAQDPNHLRILRQLAPRSVMAVPIVSRQRLLGVITFISTDARRRYGPKDLLLAEELARRAGYAVDNAQLYQQACQATRDREDLLAVVSHDLKNPLSAILMGVNALVKISDLDTDDSGMRPHLARIERSAVRMHHLIEDLLNSASIEAGRLSVVPAPLNLATVVSEAVEAQRLIAERKYIHVIHVESPAELPAVTGDAGRLQQVMANLLGNAIKFTPAGGALTVRTLLSGDWVTVSIADTGPGIAQEDLPHLFDRFWQARRGTGLGNGLGLFISKGIVEALGGRIWAESEPGSGSTFCFSLPVAGRVAEGAIGKAEQPPALRAASQTTHGEPSD
jgi:PAS domain S-box-containing protein